MQENISLNQHAYIVAEPDGETVSSIKNAIESIFEIKLDGNPDFHFDEYETFGIDESRALKEEQSRRALDGGKKIFIIKTGGITREAQNALLKVFEEPTGGTYVFLIVPTLRVILPTLRSRARVVETIHNSQLIINKNAEEFVSTISPLRLQLPFVKKMIEDKDKAVAESFLNDIETVLHSQKETSPQFFHELFKMRGYIYDRSASVKMILEYISLVAPVIK